MFSPASLCVPRTSEKVIFFLDYSFCFEMRVSLRIHVRTVVFISARHAVGFNQKHDGGFRDLTALRFQD